MGKEIWLWRSVRPPARPPEHFMGWADVKCHIRNWKLNNEGTVPMFKQDSQEKKCSIFDLACLPTSRGKVWLAYIRNSYEFLLTFLAWRNMHNAKKKEKKAPDRGLGRQT